MKKICQEFIGKNLYCLTGFVTTTRVTHATPAPLYAHGPNRKWEGSVPNNYSHCKDIARQLIEDEPGKSIKVLKKLLPFLFYQKLKYFKEKMLKIKKIFK